MNIETKLVKFAGQIAIRKLTWMIQRSQTLKKIVDLFPKTCDTHLAERHCTHRVDHETFLSHMKCLL